MDDELNVPVKFKGTKCIFSSCVPTRDELDMFIHFDTKIHNECNIESVNIHDLR